MILDTLENSSLYERLGPGFAAAFAWLRRHGAAAAGAPVEIGGGLAVARPGAYVTHGRDAAKFECHRRFADVQFVAAGEEIVEVAPPAELRPVAPYDPAADVAWFASDAPRRGVLLPAGSFLVLWPHEAHQPGIAAPRGPCAVRKVVVKVDLGRDAPAREALA
ncbi:MAG: YhcH/YjgK/YiaL family protein [Kiritimatiellae bacterium]|nr:YhcH/YjgK/YiaL family protein [Kiritimatiellia bacterium]